MPFNDQQKISNCYTFACDEDGKTKSNQFSFSLDNDGSADEMKLSQHFLINRTKLMQKIAFQIEYVNDVHIHKVHINPPDSMNDDREARRKKKKSLKCSSKTMQPSGTWQAESHGKFV